MRDKLFRHPVPTGEHRCFSDFKNPSMISFIVLWFVVFVGAVDFYFFTQFQFRLPCRCVTPAALSKQFLSKKCLQL